MQLTTTLQQAILIGAVVYLVVGLLEAWFFFRTTRLWWPTLREGIFLEMVAWPVVSLVAGFLLVPLWYFLVAYGGRWVRDCFARVCCFCCRCCCCCWRRRKSKKSLDAAAAAVAAADLEAARVVPYEPTNEVS
jgi:hypothetical protein